MYFLAHNVAKKHNVGTIARCCTAFGVKSLVLIGSREYNAFGAHGADGHVRFEHFDSLQDARKKLKEERGCTQILGVEIVEDARPIESHPFTGNTAFIMGNEVRSIDAEAIDGCRASPFVVKGARQREGASLLLAGPRHDGANRKPYAMVSYTYDNMGPEQRP